jgi:hypothetical protein
VNEKKTVTVVGVPVTVTVIGRELAVQVGRFDPQAAAGLLRVHSLSGTAAVAVYVAAGEGGPGGTGERWVAGLYPALPGAAERGAAPGQRSKPARLRKPNRVTTSRQAVLNGARTSHASMPRARGRWRPDSGRNEAGAPGRGETASPSEGKPREES